MKNNIKKYILIIVSILLGLAITYLGYLGFKYLFNSPLEVIALFAKIIVVASMSYLIGCVTGILILEIYDKLKQWLKY